MSWEVVIGLELHVQLSTRTKIFSGASAEFGAAPNSQASAVDLGLPGVLPVVNEAVYPKAVRFALGVGADICQHSTFDRKNYFYPDLPKGYQITQMREPIVKGGSIDINLEGGATKTIRITQAHLEEDAGKSLHEDFHGMTGIDLNRAGVPLLEVVSEPDMRSAQEAVAYARAIHQLVTWLDISDGDMSQGSLRCDANVSLRRPGESELGTRTETKNLNSFRFLQRAIEHEVARQQEVLESGGQVLQETRLYDPEQDQTRPMRSKETAMDYRYFPDPDLLPVALDQASLARLEAAMPELPWEKRHRYVADYGLPPADAQLLCATLPRAEYFEATVAACQDAPLAANWIKGELLAQLNREEKDITASPVAPEALAQLLARIQDKTISGKQAKQVFAALWDGSAQSVDGYIEAQGLRQVTDTGALEPLVNKVLDDNPKEVAQYQAGKTKLLGFLVGQVMKESGGKANPKQVNDLVKEKLSSKSCQANKPAKP